MYNILIVVAFLLIVSMIRFKTYNSRGVITGCMLCNITEV